jgi:type I restriction enzyme M protein
MALKKSELYSSLWASCDELRGSMDASQYKDYVLVMLFVKYVSDKYAGQKYSDIEVPEGASFSDMVALKGQADIGDQINKKIIAPLANANKLPEADFPDFNDANKLGSGKEMVDRLTNLIGIFENPALNFSKNRAEGDDLLGDAYEFLMRHFAAESGKSKGQFYTPAEVSRIMAQIVGIRSAKTSRDTTVYDPTCGSGSLLLKVAAEAPTEVTLYGQEKFVVTAGLARMNMILHNYATAVIEGGASTLADPKFKEGANLKTFDYVVANPPFSDKVWTSGFTPENDEFRRFSYGVPPKKQGDYAFLLHIVASLKSTGKGACILPHGVLFRGNAEAVIRKNLIQRGYIKAIIGLPANLFYGTGIPACIVLVDKEGAADRKNIFMIDASKGFTKDGPKNRLREQDIHKIVDVFTRRDESDPKFARVVPISEISDPKNDYNLNLPRYIDSTEPEDLQDLDGHLNGGIPERDIDALSDFWDNMPNLRETLFEAFGRSGYVRLKEPISEVKSTIFAHPEFVEFHESATQRFEDWVESVSPILNSFASNRKPKELIETISESLLNAFKDASLVDGYDVYQHIMSYWAEVMQDDCYLISEVGWKEGAPPREIFQVKNKDGKQVWLEKEDFKKGKRRFKSDLVPSGLLIERYFSTEHNSVLKLENEIASLQQSLDEMRDENSGEEGLLNEVIEGEGDKQKITAKSLKSRLKEIGRDPDYAEERVAILEYTKVFDQLAQTKSELKDAQGRLEELLDEKYPDLTEEEIKTLVVEGKWLSTISNAVKSELDRVSQTLTSRIRELAERYATPLPHLADEVTTLSARVDEHLKRMGLTWD